MAGFVYRKLAAPLIQLAGQGVTPQMLATSLALGLCIGCFPVLGTTTILCTMVALTWRVNLPAILLANWTALPLQLFLLLPLVHLGGKLFLSKESGVAPAQLSSLMSGQPWHATKQIWTWQWHAIVAWLLVAPLACILLTLILRTVLRKLAIFNQPYDITVLETPAEGNEG